MQPRRSVLYMPGSNARALDKARSLPADSLILDLEDAVSPAQKGLARDQVISALAEGGYGKQELVVRINALDSEWGEEDLAAVAASPAHAVCLPKVESAEQVRQVSATLKAAGSRQSIWIMAETPRGVLSIDAIAGADSRLQVIVMGTSDLAKELRVPHTPARLGLLSSLGQCVLAARAHGLDILDGVHLDLEDEAGFQLSCGQGVELGFDGKTLIHPKQIGAANRAFAPSVGALERARKIQAAWSEAEAAGQGVVLVDGKLVESLHVQEAQRLLALQAAIEAVEIA